MRPPLRVAQWATGNIGLRSLEAVLDHPDLELVGVYAYSPGKVGKDAGELCGRDAVGVMATNELSTILAADPDCVLYMGDRLDVGVLCELLEAGINVIATRSEIHHPESLDPALRDRLQRACEAGQSTLHGTGISPGFVTEALPIVLTSIQRRLDHLSIDEFADLSSRPSPELLFTLMGFGKTPEQFGPERWAHIGAAFGPSLRVLGDALSLQIDTIEPSGEVAVARRNIEIAAGVIQAGTVAGQRITVTASHRGQPLLRFRATWFCTAELDPDWETQSSGWRVLVDGDAPLDVKISFAVAPENYGAMTPSLTANRPVNAIRYVCDAKPGIRTTADLPQIIANLRTA